MKFAQANTMGVVEDLYRSMPDFDWLADKMMQAMSKPGTSRAERDSLRAGAPVGNTAEMAAMLAMRALMQNKTGDLNYAAASYQQMMSGGVQMNVTGGVASGLTMLQGNGRITSELNKQFAREVNMRTLGASMDSRNNYGRNVEDISVGLNWYAGKQSLGVAGTLRQGLTADQVAEVRMRELPPDLMQSFSAMREKAKLTGSDAGARSFYKEQSGKEGIDSRLKSLAGGLSSQTDVVELNPAYAEAASKLSRKVSKALSQMENIYGKLTEPELLMKLQTLTGNSGIDQQSATLDKMLRVAKSNGIDPRSAFKDLTNPATLMAGMQLAGQGYGLDRGGVRLQDSTSALQEITLKYNGAALQRASDTVNKSIPEGMLFDKGAYMVDAQKAWSTAAHVFDKRMGNTLSTALGWADSRPGEKALGNQLRKMISSMGGMSSDEQWKQQDKIQKLMFEKTGQSLSWLAGTEAGLSEAKNMNADSAEAILDATQGDLIKPAVRALAVSPAMSRVARADRGRVAADLVTGLGMSGMTALAATKGPEMAKQFFDANNVPAGVRTALTNPDGSVNQVAVKSLQETLRPLLGKAGGASNYDRNVAEANRLNTWSPDVGAMLGGAEGGFSLKNIIGFALSKDGEKLYNDDQYRTQALLGLDAYRRKGVKGGDAWLGAVQVSDYRNLNAADLEKLQKLSGKKDFNLLSQMGASSYEDLVKSASADTPAGRKRKLEILNAIAQEGDIELTKNTDGSTTAVSKDKIRSKTADVILERGRLATAAAGLMDIPENELEDNVVLRGIMDTGKFVAGGDMVSGSGFSIKGKGVWVRDKNKKWTWSEKSGGTITDFIHESKWVKGKTADLTNWDKTARQMKLVGDMDEKQLESARDLDRLGGGAYLKSFESQRSALSSAIKSIDANELKGVRDAEGKDIERNKLVEMLDGLDQTIKKLQGGGGSDKETVVHTMRVENLDVSKSHKIP